MPSFASAFPRSLSALAKSFFFQRQTGTVLADAGLQFLMQAAETAGVHYVAPERVVRLEQGPTVKVHTEHRTFEGRQVVVAAGPLAKNLLDGAGLELPLAPAVAQVAFLDAPALANRPGIAKWRANGETGIYGHPVPGIGYKIAFDVGAEGWHPDVEERKPDLDEEKRLLEWLAQRMPSVIPKVSRTQRHPWTMTPDVDFIIDRWESVIVAGGRSGHAFKFGSALGRLVADVVEGGDAPTLTRLDRPAFDQPDPSPSAPIKR